MNMAISGLTLRRADLHREQTYIGGEWREAGSGETIIVTNPASGAKLGTVPALSAAEVEQAVIAAREAFPAWAQRTAKDRATILHRWWRLMMEHQEDLARLMTAEQGKPLAESRGEIAYAASFIEWFAEEGRRLYGEIIPAAQNDRRIMVLRQPIGVTAAITPWNFPTAMITRKAGPALAAGNAMVIKPASATPYSALALCVLAEEAGIPPGILSVVTGKASVVGSVLTGHPDIRKFSFTGSTEIGRELMAQCAHTIKKVSLELGGNAPFIVFDDADLDAAVAGALVCKFRNAGQTCVCANRIYVQDAVYDDFAQRLAKAVNAMKVGDGLQDGVEIGPMIDDGAIAKVEQHLCDAKEKGARVIVGGDRHDMGGLYFQPTILVDVTSAMAVAREETFGPLAPLFRFQSEAEVIAQANDTEFGLAAYFYTRDLGRTWRVAEGLEYGMVGINTGILSTEVAPFGGVKESGIGREGSHHGIEEYTEIKYLNVAGL